MKTWPTSVTPLVSHIATMWVPLSLLLGWDPQAFHFLTQCIWFAHCPHVTTLLKSFEIQSESRRELSVKTIEEISLLLRVRSWSKDPHAWEEKVFLPGYLGVQNRSPLNLTCILNVIPAVSSWISGLQLPGRMQSANDIFMSYVYLGKWGST